MDAYLACSGQSFLLDDGANTEAHAPIAYPEPVLIFDSSEFDHVATTIVGDEPVERGKDALTSYRIQLT